MTLAVVALEDALASGRPLGAPLGLLRRMLGSGTAEVGGTDTLVHAVVSSLPEDAAKKGLPTRCGG